MRSTRWWEACSGTRSVWSGRRATTRGSTACFRTRARAGSASSTTWPSEPCMPWPSSRTRSSEWRSSILTCTTATALRRSSTRSTKRPWRSSSARASRPRPPSCSFRRTCTTPRGPAPRTSSTLAAGTRATQPPTSSTRPCSRSGAGGATGETSTVVARGPSGSILTTLAGPSSGGSSKSAFSLRCACSARTWFSSRLALTPAVAMSEMDVTWAGTAAALTCSARTLPGSRAR
mmetsp:Transcript_18852/g.60184  ORF Transcript_18852/g.60184 Transcript_18852/m.60184 type:complete len:233 (-) Transcript_18852:1115-1813(-)